jgi:hypothetical protein
LGIAIASRESLVPSRDCLARNRTLNEPAGSNCVKAGQ